MHALWGFEWLPAVDGGWVDVVGFFVGWSVGVWTVLYVACIGYRLVVPGLGDR